MKVVPITLKRANQVVAEWHRHNRPVVGARFSLGCEHDGMLIGVVIVGRPIARMLDNSTTAEITRLVAIDGAPKNTCSFLYGAARRVWFSMGGTKILTYTLQSESGASLRGAGFIKAHETEGASWSRKSRERETQPVQMQAKIRWESEP